MTALPSAVGPPPAGPLGRSSGGGVTPAVVLAGTCLSLAGLLTGLVLWTTSHPGWPMRGFVASAYAALALLLTGAVGLLVTLVAARRRRAWRTVALLHATTGR